jgi:hypothetical protein
MQSMCRQNYNARFDHNKEECPNIVPYPNDIVEHPRYGKMNYIPIWTKYDHDLNIRYESLPAFWNEWYKMYANATFPRIIVRLEDLVFYGDSVLPQLCQCAGLKYAASFTHAKHIANQNHGIDQNGTHTGLLRSVIRYGNITNRRSGYPDFQLHAAHDILDVEMMGLFSYPYEEPEKDEVEIDVG